MGPELSVDTQLQTAARAIAANLLPADVEIAFIPQEPYGGTFEFPLWSLAEPFWPSAPAAR